MAWAARERARKQLAKEQGTIRKDWGGRVPIALVYPNTYYLGMSNLGFQTVYARLNAHPDVVCERGFVERPRVGQEIGQGRDEWAGIFDAHGTRYQRADPEPPMALESGRPLSDFAVIAFSLSYELDYFNVIEALQGAGLPLFAADRDERHPLVIGGGPGTTGNPQPLAPFFDAFVIGEAEPVVEPWVEALREVVGQDRATQLEALATIRGFYVPAIHGVYAGDLMRPEQAASSPVERVWAADLNDFPTTSRILTPDTELGDLYLLEITRGCARGCRFCMAGYMILPMRLRSVECLLEQAKEGLQYRNRLGLIGASVSDHPQIDELVTGLRGLGAQVAFSSLRIDRLSPALLEALTSSGTRTITLAPEAGTERLRKYIRKTASQEKIDRGIDLVARQGVKRLKLYFMVGLPSETDEDIQGIADLAIGAKRRLEQERGRGEVIVNVTPFVPKAGTPFQWERMATAQEIGERLARLRKDLRSHGVLLRHDSVGWQVVQAVLARGDARVAPVLAKLERVTLKSWERAVAKEDIDVAALLGPVPEDQALPWGFIEQGLRPGLLERERARAQATLTGADWRERAPVAGPV